MISKKRVVFFVLILYCVSICSITFGCTIFKHNSSEWLEYCFEDDVKYRCLKKSNEAYVYEIYRTIYDKDLQKYVSSYDFDENIETIVIPETVKDGQYKVVGLETPVLSPFLGSVAPRSWKNIKKIYFPYTMWNMHYLQSLKSGEVAYYDGRMLAIVPNLGSKQKWSNLKETFYTYFKGDMFFVPDKYLCGVVPQKHYDLVLEELNKEITEEYQKRLKETGVENITTPNYVFNFNYEGAPNEGIYWIDLIVDENTPYVLPTVPTRGGYTFGGWYTEESLENEWDNQMTPTTEVKTMYAKWVPVETEQPTESEETAK